MTPSRRHAGPGRAAVLVFGLFVAVGLIIVFSGTLARSTDIESQAATIRTEVELLRARVAAGEAEIGFLTTEAFLQQQARVEGFGEPGEVRFALPDDAPPPEPIVPIGSRAREAAERAPFDAWLDLLFGS